MTKSLPDREHLFQAEPKSFRLKPLIIKSMVTATDRPDDSERERKSRDCPDGIKVHGAADSGSKGKVPETTR
ncbi:MAG: hypothetical protein QNK37_12530 [Acidobacteriota bacterium]|nr:hypothetical protein [Acidobacteriota bacterium]